MKKNNKKKVSKKPVKAKSKTSVVKQVTVSNKTGIFPLGSRVLIKPFTKEELQSKNNFGIILPDSGSKDKSEQGLVLAIGPGDYQDGKLVPVSVRVGDKVAFSKYGYEEVKVGNDEYFLIKEDSILAIIK